jgi:large subunit ribosomal protein L30
MLRIKLVRSPIGHNWRNRRTIAALGLRKVHQVVEQPDNPSVRGMIHHVQSMVTVEVVEGEPTAKASKGVKGKEVKGKAVEPKATPKAKKGAEKPIEEVPQPAASNGEEAEAKPKKAPAKKKVEENA